MYIILLLLLLILDIIYYFSTLISYNKYYFCGYERIVINSCLICMADNKSTLADKNAWFVALVAM